MELDPRSVTSEPASPTSSAGEEKMEVASELSSPTWHSRDSGLFERGIKTMLSIRKSKQSLNKEKGKEGTGTWKGKRLSLRFSKSSEGNKTTVSNGTDEIGEKIEAELIQGKPLSVMEINDLIQKRQLLEAFACIKYLEDETIAERDAEKYKDNLQELVRKSKDVDLLYNSIANTIQSIVVGTLEHPTVEGTMLTSLATLIAREEAAHPNTGNAAGPGSDLLGTPRKWREEWREAINESARKRVLRVPMASKEEESSWLDLHLGFLQKHLTEDLLKIKLSVKKCYPEDYQVCDTYVEAFHKAIASHLQDISQRPLEFNELYTLLDWVANTYHSELFLGHPDLKPEVKTENLSLLLTPADWDKLKNDYITSAKGKIKSYFGNILRLEVTEKWEKEVHPEVKENLYHSSFSFDIQTIIGEHMKISGAISRSLETKTLELCLAELHEFIPRSSPLQAARSFQMSPTLVRGGVRGMEHCSGQPHLCTLFCCLHQQLPRPGVSRLPLSQATALLGSRRAAASRKERTRVLGVPRWVLSLQPFLTSRGRVAQEMQIKVTRVKRRKQGWIWCLRESFKLIFSPSFSALEAGFFHFLFWRLALQTQQHGLKAAFGTGLEEIL
ncbi:exocyst complex component 3-like protein 4 isoform X3 [Grus americana]|uniref:exocyst complex component 3-like protein 4 isoform X3 n=1 Tax=Grus americana TaxID=9117 RepID=UPI002407D3D9|nr:exocyst complex component 3-like protein 4 isoform X3 [Grus americana]